MCFLHMLPFHNVIFFHNYCLIGITPMSTAYPQHIHTVLFTITQPSKLYVLFTYASFSQCDIFSQSLHNSLYKNVYSISSTYTYGTVYNYTTHILYVLLHMLPFHNVIFFHNYCTIGITPMSTAYPQHIHIVLFTTTLQCILALLFIYAFLFTMWYFFTITAQFTLQQCLQHILNIYIQYCLQLHYPLEWLCCLHMLFFSQCDIFSQLLHNWHYNNVYSISATYTYSTVYNYSPMYTGFAVYICFPFHNVIFFHNHCPIHSTTMFTAYTQHIHTVLFTITLPSTLALLFIYAFLFTMWYFSTITAQLTLQKCL